MKKKGFTLIELIIVLAIASMISAIEIKSLAKCNKVYKNSMKELKNELNINEALIFIDSKINDYSICNVNNNEIVVINNSGEKEIIRKRDDKLIICYCKYFNKYNTISNGIKEFKVYRRKNVIIVNIIGTNNKIYGRSYSLKEND